VANRPRSWITVYLITFMMLHSCALLTEENYGNARKQGLRVGYIPSMCLCLILLSTC
jgi:hypothetical protein